MQPATDPFTLRLGIPGEFPKRFDSEFLRAAVVMNDAGNGAGRGLIMSHKDRLEVSSGGFNARRSYSVARCVHNLLTSVALRL